MIPPLDRRRAWSSRGESSPSFRGNVVVGSLAAAATSLADPVRDLYRRVADGGFGPGDGFIGLMGGVTART